MIKLLTSLARIDFRPRHSQPLMSRLVLATVAAVAGSLAADALLVVIGQALFPSTRGYVHFQFSDYAKLTVIGVIIACAAWPVVTRIPRAPLALPPAGYPGHAGVVAAGHLHPAPRPVRRCRG